MSAKVKNKEVKTKEDLNNLNVEELKDFLRARGVSTKGRRKDLLQLAELYFSYPVLRLQNVKGTSTPSASKVTSSSNETSSNTTTTPMANQSSSVFVDDSLGWKQIEESPFVHCMAPDVGFSCDPSCFLQESGGYRYMCLL